MGTLLYICTIIGGIAGVVGLVVSVLSLKASLRAEGAAASAERAAADAWGQARTEGAAYELWQIDALCEQAKAALEQGAGRATVGLCELAIKLADRWVDRHSGVALTRTDRSRALRVRDDLREALYCAGIGDNMGAVGKVGEAQGRIASLSGSMDHLLGQAIGRKAGGSGA